MPNKEIVNKLSKREYALFAKLYDLRILSLKQAYSLYYKDVCSFATFVQKRVLPLKKAGLIKIKSSNSGTVAMQLTNDSITLLREYKKIPKEIFDSETGRIKKTFLSESDIDVYQKQVSHQLSLNQFVLDFGRIYNKKIKSGEYTVRHKYFDEKYISKFDIVRPDGMIVIGNTYLFLEQDMGTESRKQLNDKWNKYRRFLRTSSSLKKDMKIVVLFIVDCEESQLQNRKDLIRNTISTVFIDILSDQFDIYIGTKKEMLEAAFNKIIPLEFKTYKEKVEKPIEKILNYHQYHLIDKETFSRVINTGGAKYGGYIRRLNKNNKIVVENKKIQEFLYDDYFFAPVSVISKMEYAKRSSSLFYTVKRRDIDYLIVTDHIKGLYYHLKSANLLNRDGIFFTTIDRLKTMSFPNALFVFDKEGNLFHCIDSSYVAKMFEYNIFAKA